MGEIYVLTGTGAGKTTGALGLALRAVGQRKRVVIIQFLKWWKDTGEYKVRRRLAPYYEIHQFGRKGWRRRKELGEKDKELVRRGLEFAREVVRRKKPDLLILDELNLALAWGMAEVGEVLKLLDELPEKTDVVVTGRYAPRELVERADVVNEVVEVKRPRRLITKRGIQY